jgi:pyridoxamine 5'-phosphate oxidase
MAPWTAELREQVAAVEGPSLLTMATLAADGSPNVRTLVVRGITDEGGVMACSDARSSKNAEIAADARAAACLWYDHSRTQYRLRGRVEMSRDPQVWHDLSDTARALFHWPASGEPREHDGAFVQAVADDKRLPPATFAVLTLVPDEAERLVLAGFPHRRTIWTRPADSWVAREVNP